MSETISTPELPSLGVIASLGVDDRNMLSSYGTFHMTQVGQEIIRQGEAQDCLFILLSGSMLATTAAYGLQLPARPIHSGEMFGEINLFDPASASSTVTALEPSQYWKISRDSLSHFLQQYPVPGSQLLIAVTSVLARRLRTVNISIFRAQAALLGQSD